MGYAVPPVQRATVTGTAVTSIVKAYGSNIGSGNRLLLAFFAWIGNAEPAGMTITDTLGVGDGTAWAVAVTKFDASWGSALSIWYRLAPSAGGANTITADFAGLTRTVGLVIWEESGNATANVLDKTSSASGSGATPDPGAQTTTTDGQLIVGLYDDEPATGGTVAGTNFTLEDSVTPGAELMFTEDWVQPNFGSVSANWTKTGGAWNALMATFKAAAAGGPVLDADYLIYQVVQP